MIVIFAILISQTEATISRAEYDKNNNLLDGQDLDRKEYSRIYYDQDEELMLNPIDINHIKANLGKSQKIAIHPYDSRQLIRNEISYEKDGTIALRFTEDPEICKIYATKIIPALSKLTGGTIRIANSDDQNVNILKIFKTNEKRGSEYNPMDKSIVIGTEDQYPIIMHEFLHFLGFGHPSDLLGDASTIMSYSAGKPGAASSLEVFKYILEDDNAIDFQIPQSKREQIYNFVEKYKDLLELGLTPRDICDVQSQFTKNDALKDEVKKEIDEIGLEYLSFELLGNGYLKYLGTESNLSYLLRNNELGSNIV